MLKKISSCLVSTGSLTTGRTHFAQANDVSIWYETFGKKENPAVLLIMGGCCQGVLWPKIFCEKLANEGFHVIRYDHRDSGLSTCFDFEKQPYDPLDMAQDAVSVLDAAGVKKARIFGVSLGAFIAELMAGYFPERVDSILLMGSTTNIHPMNLAYANLPQDDQASLPPPSPDYLAWMKEYMKLAPKTDEEKLAQREAGWNKLNGQKFPLNETINREIHREFLSRMRFPQGVINHITMLRRELSEELVRTVPSKIKVPTVIIHGTEDPIFAPDHGEALHRAIPHSKYLLMEGMGHVPGDHFFDLYIDLIKTLNLRF